MIEVDEYYKKKAHELTNMLFDKRFLNDQLSRESIDWLEEFIAFSFQSQVDTAVRCEQLTASMRDK